MEKLKSLLEIMGKLWPILLIIACLAWIAFMADSEERKEKREHKKIIKKNLRNNATKLK